MRWLTLRRLHSDNWEARRGALLELGQSGDRSLLPTLLESLSDLQPEVRDAACEALDGLDPAWRDAPATRDAIRRHASELGSSSSPSAAAALAAIGPTAAGYLAENFHTFDEPAQSAAVDLFAQTEYRPVADALLDGFDALRPAVQLKALRLFGQFRERRAVGRLVHALRFQPAAEASHFPASTAGSPYRRCAAFALGKIRDKSSVEDLVVARTDPEHGVREAAAEALDQVDADWRSSEAARRALPVAIARMALDGSHDIRAPREARMLVMELLGEHPPRGFAFHGEYLRFVASGALATHPAASEAVPLLIDALSETAAGWDKDESARLLGRIGDKRAVAALYEAVAEKRSCRLSAAEALFALGESESLSSVLTGEEVRTLRERAEFGLKPSPSPP